MLSVASLKNVKILIRSVDFKITIEMYFIVLLVPPLLLFYLLVLIKSAKLFLFIIILPINKLFEIIWIRLMLYLYIAEIYVFAFSLFFSQRLAVVLLANGTALRL